MQQTLRRKTFLITVLLAFCVFVCGEGVQQGELIVHTGRGEHTISRFIYGHFAEHLGRCIYEGLWVGPDSPIPNTRGIRNDVLEALRAVKVPVLRWPGGCFADEYHWMDGIGPREKRPVTVNTFWGGVLENNHFGTHEFFDLCDLLGCEPYVSMNVGSGTVKEMQQWIEYMTCDQDSEMANLRRKNGRKKAWILKYVSIGNESWGCGGFMTPEYYVDVYKRYQAFVRHYSGNEIYKIACGPYADNYHWLEVLMEACMGRTEWGRVMDGMSPHYYCGSGTGNRSATDFAEAEWFGLLKNALMTEELILNYKEVMDEYDPDKKIAIIFDEWGACHQVEPGTNPRFCYQQSTLRDALAAGIHFNIFNNHCDRVRMAAVAQVVNVIQSLILTNKEKMVLTPTYHVFEMYTVHHDTTLLPVDTVCRDYYFEGRKIPGVTASASRDEAGMVHVSICNLNPSQPVHMKCRLGDFRPASVQARVLTHEKMTAHNTFDAPNVLHPQRFSGFEIQEHSVAFTLPSKSVLVLSIKGK